MAFADVIINPPPLGHRSNNGSKIIVCQHHICHILCDICTGNAHANTDIRRLNGGSVIDAIAGHGSDAALLLPSADNSYLMLWLNPGIDGVVSNVLCQLRIAELIQLCTGDRLLSGSRIPNCFAMATAVSR